MKRLQNYARLLKSNLLAKSFGRDRLPSRKHVLSGSNPRPFRVGQFFQRVIQLARIIRRVEALN